MKPNYSPFCLSIRALRHEPRLKLIDTLILPLSADLASSSYFKCDGRGRRKRRKMVLDLEDVAEPFFQTSKSRLSRILFSVFSVYNK
jgi:hypothetical protein